MALDPQTAQAIRETVAGAINQLKYELESKVSQSAAERNKRIDAALEKVQTDLVKIQRQSDRMSSHLDSERELQANKFQDVVKQLEKVGKLVDGDGKEPLSTRMALLEGFMAEQQEIQKGRSSWWGTTIQGILIPAICWGAAAVVWIAIQMNNTGNLPWSGPQQPPENPNVTAPAD